MAQGQDKPVYTSKSGKTYPFIWNKPGQPTDADFDAFEREVEQREASSSKPPPAAGGGGGQPSPEYRFINNAFEASPLNLPGMISGLIGMASNPSKIPDALKRSLVDPIRQHGQGAAIDLAGQIPGVGLGIETARQAVDPSRRDLGRLATSAMGLPQSTDIAEGLPLLGPGYTQAREQVEAGDVAGGFGTAFGNTGNLMAGVSPRSMVNAATALPRKITDALGRFEYGAPTSAVRGIFDEGLGWGSPAGGARRAADAAASTRSGVQTAVTPVRGQLPPTPAPGLLSTARGFFNRAGDDLGISVPPSAPRVPPRPPPGSSGVVEPRRFGHGEAPQSVYKGTDPADMKSVANFVQTVIDDPRLTTGAPARALDVEAAMLGKARAKPGSVNAPMREALGSEIRTQVGRGYPAQKPALDRLGRLDQSQTVLDRAARRAPSSTGVPFMGDVKYGLVPWLLKRSGGTLGQAGHSALNLADELLPPLTRAAILSQLDRDDNR